MSERLFNRILHYIVQFLILLHQMLLIFNLLLRRHWRLWISILLKFSYLSELNIAHIFIPGFDRHRISICSRPISVSLWLCHIADLLYSVDIWISSLLRVLFLRDICRILQWLDRLDGLLPRLTWLLYLWYLVLRLFQAIIIHCRAQLYRYIW